LIAKSNHQTKPRARKDRLIVHELPDELLIYDLDRDRAHCLNETAAFVWQRCDGRNSTQEIAQALGKNANRQVDEKIVWLAIDQLARNHLLAVSPPRPFAIANMNRREVMRALGITAAVIIPVVASIVAPTPAQAATCLPNGAACGSSAQCCSGLCSGGICGAP
jgi:coenzyme PQQ synthesis protein D (PqqD)